MGRTDDTDTLLPRRPDRGNITAERLLFMVEETEAEIIRSGTVKAKASDDTNPGGSGSSEVFFNRNPGRLKLSKLSDNTNPRGLKLSDVFFLTNPCGFRPSKPSDSKNLGRMILDECYLKKIFAD